ncbi:protein kinase domain-containing protein [Candidatus Uabimicrobium amorphum]|uniref:Protein kinase domain-containing protein n=1 Tax=Uabimicrobium amorphum TaxID=2596890 RepID=A0A5S9IQA2_UABAM|nr:protein kinase [Candidatus Uabimicrobium amorphum]BBM85914.1 hypothetical protein UABAM_04296 [Candidatus Uabimicrobium amorphum]
MDEDRIKKIWKDVIPEEELENSNPGSTYKSVKLEKGTIASLELPFITLTSDAAQQENSDEEKDTRSTASGGKNHFATALTLKYEDDTRRIGGYATTTLNYELLDEIARGGMGVVFKGKQLSLRREVAIKKIKSAKEDVANKDKFISESLVTAYLDHPNIVPVYDLGQNEKEEVFLAMKLVGGTEWKSLLNPKTAQDKELAQKYNIEKHLGILINVCNAIAYAHSKKIVHNDLKPSNVMVGEFGEVLVMDWGIAVDIRDSDERGDETMTMHRSLVKSPMGTPHYMPWELAEGAGTNIGPWTDVYLLGGILYHILMRTPPHRGGTLEALVSAITGKLPAFPKAIPKELQQICSKALSKEISQRYQSVSDFQKALQGYLQHSESLVISAKARNILKECLQVEQKLLLEKERNKLYAKFAQAVSGFEQALELWQENEEAMRGQHAARLAYANVALINEDFGLADAQIAPVTETGEIKQLKVKIAEARIKKIQMEQATKKLRITVYAALIFIIAGLTVGFLLVNRAQQELAKEKKTVEQQKDAIQQQKDAITKQLAEIGLKKAEEAYQKSLLEDEEININSYMKQERAYRECGAYAGKALDYLRELKDFDDLQNKGRAFVKLALQQRKEVWHSPSYGHSGSPGSLTFTHDDQAIVSIYDDNKLQLWNVKTGKEVAQFKKYMRNALTIAFSADGTILACGMGEFDEEQEEYRDCQVKLWNVKTGREVLRFTKHKMPVKHVVFSEDGNTIFSSSGNNTARLWNINTGKQLSHIQHADTINSAAFHHNNKILATASSDKTVKLWNIQTGKEILQLKGHSDMVTSIAFAKGSKILASASEDQTIRLWDTTSGQELSKIVAHSDAINSIKFNHDGEILASASRDHTIKLWDLQTRKSFLSLTGHTATVNAIAFSHNDQILASASEDHTIRLWNTVSGKELSQIAGHTAAIHSTAFSHDGEILASASRDHTVKLWDTKTGKKLFHLKGHDAAVNAVAFSRHNILASASEDRTIKFWNTTTGQQLSQITAHNATIHAIAFGHDGKTLASGSEDHTIKLWEVETGEELLHLQGHSDTVNAVAFSNDGKFFASASSDKTVRLWDSITGKQLSVFTAHTGKVYSVAFSPNSKMLASSSGDEYGNDCAIKLWECETRKEIAHFVGHDYTVYSVAFHPGGQILASGSYDNTVRLWNIQTGKQISKITGHSDVVYTVAFSPNGSRLASGSGDQSLKVWDVNITNSFLRITPSPHKVNTVAFHSDSKIIASGSWDGKIALWDTTTGKNVANFVGHTGKVHSLAFSHSGKILASGAGIYDDDNEEYQDCSVRLWDVDKGKELIRCNGHNEPIKSVIFSRDGQIVASGSWDNTVRLWDTTTGKELLMLNGYSRNIRSIAFSPQNKMIASSWDGAIRIWNITTGKEIMTLHGHTDDISCLVFHPNGKLLASGANDNTIRLWEIATGKLVSILTGHTSYVLSIAFSPDGNTLASGSWDKTIRLWNVTTGKEFSKLVGHSQSVNSVAFSPNGKILGSGSWDQSVRLWNIEKNKTLPWFDSMGNDKRDSFYSTLQKTPQELTKRLFGLQVNQNMELEPYVYQQRLWQPLKVDFLDK